MAAINKFISYKSKGRPSAHGLARYLKSDRANRERVLLLDGLGRELSPKDLGDKMERPADARIEALEGYSDWAKREGVDFRRDRAGNLVVRGADGKSLLVAETKIDVDVTSPDIETLSRYLTREKSSRERQVLLDGDGRVLSPKEAVRRVRDAKANYWHGVTAPSEIGCAALMERYHSNDSEFVAIQHGKIMAERLAKLTKGGRPAFAIHWDHAGKWHYHWVGIGEPGTMLAGEKGAIQKAWNIEFEEKFDERRVRNHALAAKYREQKKKNIELNREMREFDNLKFSTLRGLTGEEKARAKAEFDTKEAALIEQRYQGEIREADLQYKAYGTQGSSLHLAALERAELSRRSRLSRLAERDLSHYEISKANEAEQKARRQEKKERRDAERSERGKKLARERADLGRTILASERSRNELEGNQGEYNSETDPQIAEAEGVKDLDANESRGIALEPEARLWEEWFQAESANRANRASLEARYKEWEGQLKAAHTKELEALQGDPEGLTEAHRRHEEALRSLEARRLKNESKIAEVWAIDQNLFEDIFHLREQTAEKVKGLAEEDPERVLMEWEARLREEGLRAEAKAAKRNLRAASIPRWERRKKWIQASHAEELRNLAGDPEGLAEAQQRHEEALRRLEAQWARHDARIALDGLAAEVEAPRSRAREIDLQLIENIRNLREQTAERVKGLAEDDPTRILLEREARLREDGLRAEAEAAKRAARAASTPRWEHWAEQLKAAHAREDEALKGDPEGLAEAQQRHEEALRRLEAQWARHDARIALDGLAAEVEAPRSRAREIDLQLIENIRNLQEQTAEKVKGLAEDDPQRTLLEREARLREDGLRAEAEAAKRAARAASTPRWEHWAEQLKAAHAREDEALKGDPEGLAEAQQRHEEALRRLEAQRARHDARIALDLGDSVLADGRKNRLTYAREQLEAEQKAREVSPESGAKIREAQNQREFAGLAASHEDRKIALDLAIYQAQVAHELERKALQLENPDNLPQRLGDLEKTHANRVDRLRVEFIRDEERYATLGMRLHRGDSRFHTMAKELMAERHALEVGILARSLDLQGVPPDAPERKRAMEQLRDRQAEDKERLKALAEGREPPSRIGRSGLLDALEREQEKVEEGAREERDEAREQVQLDQAAIRGKRQIFLTQNREMNTDTQAVDAAANSARQVIHELRQGNLVKAALKTAEGTVRTAASANKHAQELVNDLSTVLKLANPKQALLDAIREFEL